MMEIHLVRLWKKTKDWLLPRKEIKFCKIFVSPILQLQIFHILSNHLLLQRLLSAFPSHLPLFYSVAMLVWEVLNRQTDWQAEQTSQFHRAEVLTGLRNFRSKDRPDHHSVDHLKERRARKGSSWQSILRQWDWFVQEWFVLRPIIALFLGKLVGDSRIGTKGVWTFPSFMMPSWTKTDLNSDVFLKSMGLSYKSNTKYTLSIEHIDLEILYIVYRCVQAFRDLWSNPRLLNVVEQLIGPDIKGHPVWNLRTKTPQNEATTVPWHQGQSLLGCCTAVYILFQNFSSPSLSSSMWSVNQPAFTWPCWMADDLDQQLVFCDYNMLE